MANILLSLWLMTLLGAAGGVGHGIGLQLLNRTFLSVSSIGDSGVLIGGCVRSAGRVLGACIPMAAICLWISGASMWTKAAAGS